MELQSDPNGNLILPLESSVLRWEYGFQDWVFGFGQGEKSGFDMGMFTQRKRSRCCVCDGGLVRGSRRGLRENEGKKKSRRRGGRGVGVGEKKKKKKRENKRR